MENGTCTRCGDKEINTFRSGGKVYVYGDIVRVSYTHEGETFHADGVVTRKLGISKPVPGRVLIGRIRDIDGLIINVYEDDTVTLLRDA